MPRMCTRFGPETGTCALNEAKRDYYSIRGVGVVLMAKRVENVDQ